MTRKFTLAATLAATSLAACNSANAGPQTHTTTSHNTSVSVYRSGETQIVGSGVVVEENRPIPAFGALAIDGPVDVVIRQGAPSLRLVAEDNIIGLIEARKDGDTLSLTTEGSFRTKKPILAYLSVPDLREVTINASGDVRLEGWDAPALSLSIRGSGDIEIDGSVDDIRARIGGSGDIDLAPVRVARVDAAINGSGDVAIGSVDRLVASVNGSGDIRAGDVGELSADVNGSGDISYRSARVITRREVNGSGDIRAR